MEVIVGVQGFKRPANKFVAKELAVLRIDATTPTTFLFKPPCSWNELPTKFKCGNAWLTRNFHGISWYSGDIRYSMVKKILRAHLQDAAKIYVKGEEKKVWLAKQLGNQRIIIINLEDVGCPSLLKLRSTRCAECAHHSKAPNYYCAVENVNLLKAWLSRSPSLELSERDIADCRRCCEHQIVSDGDGFDGPRSMIKYCAQCQLNYPELYSCFE